MPRSIISFVGGNDFEHVYIEQLLNEGNCKKLTSCNKPEEGDSMTDTDWIPFVCVTSAPVA